MSETELNEGITTILDSEKTAIKTRQGFLTLRDVLTATFHAQQTDTRWLSKIFGKKKVEPATIILHLPYKVGDYISLNGEGHYVGFHSQVTDGLELLTAIGLVEARPVWKNNEDSEEIEMFPHYGISSLGKAFVNYNENKKA